MKEPVGLDRSDIGISAERIDGSLRQRRSDAGNQAVRVLDPAAGTADESFLRRSRLTTEADQYRDQVRLLRPRRAIDSRDKY
jgi:hypothetical protein